MTLNNYNLANLTRRDAIKLGVAGGVGFLISSNRPLDADSTIPVSPAPVTLSPVTDTPLTDLWVIHGKDPDAKIKACFDIFDAHGGFINKTDSLALKVNAAFSRSPDDGANTSPQIIDAFLASCKNRGISEVVIPEHPVHDARQTFKKSGIQTVVQSHGYHMIDMGRRKQDFIDADLPDAKNLKKARITRYFLDADMTINIPVAKHHGSATLSMAMKNWMGAVEDRGIFHRNNLHQCIADLCTRIKPQWTIIDATRIMMDSGPGGPTKNMKYPDLLIVSKDQVAADAFAATLFHDNPFKVQYLKIAHEMKIGQVDLAMMNIHHLEVA